MMVYTRIDEVEGIDEQGLIVKLVSNERSTSEETWRPVCWRTVYPNSNNQNRRFYISKESIWHIPIKLAIELMDRASFKGLLDTRFDDKYQRYGGGKASFSVYNLKKHMNKFLELCLPDEEYAWARDTIFVIAEEPKSLWRKVMIASNKDDKVTFRSLTRDKSYKFRINLKNNPVWDLDRSMMDCDTAVMRFFRDSLKQYVAND